MSATFFHPFCVRTNKLIKNDVIPAPDFVSSFALGDFVYFFFRETAVEYLNCGKVGPLFPCFFFIQYRGKWYHKFSIIGNTK